jgi:hypothetical protein
MSDTLPPGVANLPPVIANAFRVVEQHRPVIADALRKVQFRLAFMRVDTVASYSYADDDHIERVIFINVNALKSDAETLAAVLVHEGTHVIEDTPDHPMGVNDPLDVVLQDELSAVMTELAFWNELYPNGKTTNLHDPTVALNNHGAELWRTNKRELRKQITFGYATAYQQQHGMVKA